jgi:hypothetical protein
VTTRLGKWELWAAIALIAATNAIVLARVAYNRSDSPDSTLQLSQRELAPPYEWGMTKENSGLSLHILDRIPNGELSPIPSNADYIADAYLYADRGAPHWMDDARLAAFGFDVGDLHARAATPRGGGPTAKEVQFVLELDGPAYANALAMARAREKEDAAMAAANPGNEKFAQRAKNAAAATRYEESDASRLFVVDAGLERDALRAKYPDRQRYAIVRGILRPVAAPAGKPVAWIDRLSIDVVNVPHALRETLGPLAVAERSAPRNKTRGKFDATVAWGRLLEPSMVDATLR